MKKTWLAISGLVFFVLLVSLSVFFLPKYFKSGKSVFNINTPILKTVINETNISVSTVGENLDLNKLTIKQDTISEYFSKIGLFPLSDKPYIGNVINESSSLNALRITNISVKNMSFEFNNISDYKNGVSPQSLYSFADRTGAPLILLTVTSFDPKTQTLTVPLYINYDQLRIEFGDQEKINNKLTKIMMFELYLNFQLPPLMKNGDPYDNFLQKLGSLNDSLLEEKASVPSFFEKIGFVKIANAQCSGADSCGTLVRPPGNCNVGGASCLDDTDCASGTCNRPAARCSWASPAILSCMGNPPYGIGCTTPCAICPSNSCTNSATPPPSGPRCGNGLCEPGESNVSCPADCTSTGGSSGGGGNTCTGACFGGLNNCGDVGRIPVSGSCSNGEMCCGFGPPVGVPCRIWDHVPVTVYVGQTIRVGFNGFVYGGIWGMSTAVTSNPLVANIFPLSENHCCGAIFGSVAQNFYITGLIPGSTWITDRWDINNQGSCQNSMLVSVIANTVIPTITLTANGSSSEISVSSGSNVTLTWRGTNVDFCTASNGWTGDKSIQDSEIQTNVTTNKRYTIICTGTNGTATASVNVNINDGRPLLPVINLNINNSSAQIVYVPQIPNVWPYGVNTWFSWTSQNATSCVGVSRPHNYPYPRNILLGPFPGWYLWDWTKPLSQVQSNNAAIGTLADTFFDLTCTGPGGTATDTIQVITGQIPDVVGDCQIPQPNDPPTSVCAPSPTANGSITWEWPPVAGANQYSVVIQTVPGFTDVLGTASGVQSSAFFNCTATECRYTTSLPTGTYRSSIIASNSADLCLPSAAGTSAPYTLDLCPVAAWWQGGAGNILSEGLITSQVPYNTLNFIEDGTSGIPGLVSGTAINTGSGAISSTGWSTNSTFGGTIPTYDDFYAQVPAGTTFIDPGANITPASLQSGGTADAAGYHWYRHTGDVTITGDVLIPSARKDILFVDGGDVNINGKIQFANRSNSFFMVIAKPTAGGLKGDIKVRSTVTAATGTPALEGMFCGSHMTTGAGNTHLLYEVQLS